MLEEAFVSAVWTAPALHWSVEAEACDDVDVRLHGTKSDREAVINKLLLLFWEWCIVVVEAVPALHIAVGVSVLVIPFSALVKVT